MNDNPMPPRASLAVRIALVIVPVIIALTFELAVGFVSGKIASVRLREAEDSSRIDRDHGAITGSVSKVRAQGAGLNASSRRPDTVQYTFELAGGQRYCGTALLDSNTTGLRTGVLNIEYALDDPMVNRVSGNRYNRSDQALLMTIIPIGVVCFIPVLVLLSFRGSADYLIHRIAFLAALITTAAIGYSAARRAESVATRNRTYTIQVDDNVLSGESVTYSARDASVSIGNGVFQVNGKTYPMPPNHAHIWLKQGNLLINGTSPGRN